MKLKEFSDLYDNNFSEAIDALIQITAKTTNTLYQELIDLQKENNNRYITNREDDANKRMKTDFIEIFRKAQDIIQK